MLAWVMCLGGCSRPTQQAEPLQLEYYYVPACESCEDGEGFAAALEEQLGDALEVGTDYVLQLKNLSYEEHYRDYQKIVEEYQDEQFYPTPPILKIGSEYLFGQDQIESMVRKTTITQRNAMLTSEQVKQRLGAADPSDSVFVYLYKEDCPYCVEIETYLEDLDTVQYLEDGSATELKIYYVDAGDPDNMPLVGALYDQYQIPEEERKSPMLLWKGGYAMGRQSIRDNMIPAILSGDALEWPGCDLVPVS